MEFKPSGNIKVNWTKNPTKVKVYGDLEATGTIAGAGTIVPADDSITHAMLKDVCVQGHNILDGTVTGNKIAANALSADAAGRARMETGFFTEAKATDAFAAGAIVGTLLKAGALAADATGRALMATGYFTEAKATDAFAAGAITGALLKAGCLTADAAGRALFAAGIFNEATATSIFAAGAIANARLKRDAGLLSADATGRALISDDHFTTASFVAGAGGKFAPGCLDATALTNVLATGAITDAVALQAFALGSVPTMGNVIADPGNGNPIPVTASGTCALTSAGAETRSVAQPAAGAQGAMLCLCCDVFVGNIVVTVADPHIDGTNNTVTFTAAGQAIWLQATQVGGNPRWRMIANSETTLSHV